MITENEYRQKSETSSQINIKNGGPEIFKTDHKIDKSEVKISSTVATYLTNAKVLIAHKEYQLALNLLRQASNNDSKNVMVLSLLANTLEEVGKLQESLTVRSVIERYQSNFDLSYKYAQLLYKLGQDELALNKYFEALSILEEEKAELFEVFKNIGNIYVRQGDFDGAEEYYNKAYTLKTDSDILLVNLGTLEIQRGDLEKARNCFRKAVELNKKNDKAWVGLAMLHSQFGDNELAWANLERALDLNPLNRTAVHIASTWSIRDHREQRAIEHVQNYLAQSEYDEEMSLALINLFCATGKVDCAQIEIERILIWNPEQVQVAGLREKLKSAAEVAL